MSLFIYYVDYKQDSSQSDWDENILGWLFANGYRILSRTRGNILITPGE